MAVQKIRGENLVQADLDSIIHPFTGLGEGRTAPTIVKSAKGIYVTFTDGRTCIDAMSAMNCVNIGYGNQRVAEAIAAQARDLAYYHSFLGVSNEPSIRLADRLLNGLLPKQMSRVMFLCSGSEAVDAAIKIIWMYNYLRGKPKKTKIISRKNSYHGVTLCGASISGNEDMHKGFNLPLPGFLHTDHAHYFDNALPGESERDYSRRLAENLNKQIEAEGPDTIAAFVCEPALGAGCAVMPPKGYFEEVIKVLRRHDILFYNDECITGFGRTGNWFACETFGFSDEPDIMTVSKGITSAYIPLSAVAISEKVWKVLRDGVPSNDVPILNTGPTSSGHPVACAASNANIDVMEEEGLIENSKKVGAFFKERLIELIGDHPLIGEIRGEGLMLGLDLVANRETKERFNPEWNCASRLVATCLHQENLIVRAFFGAHSMSFGPPLILTADEANEIAVRVKRALDTMTEELIREGRWQRN
jgi:L-2,4-diaminobutyrate transaminase